MLIEINPTDNLVTVYYYHVNKHYSRIPQTLKGERLATFLTLLQSLLISNQCKIQHPRNISKIYRITGLSYSQELALIPPL